MIVAEEGEVVYNCPQKKQGGGGGDGDDEGKRRCECREEKMPSAVP